MSWSRALLLTVRRMVLPAPQRVSTMAAIAISDMAVASCRPPLLLLVVGKGREGWEEKRMEGAALVTTRRERMDSNGSNGKNHNQVLHYYRQ